MDPNQPRMRKGKIKCLDTIVLAFLLICIVVYLLIGAVIFPEFEREAEMRVHKELDKKLQKFVQKFNMSYEDVSELLKIYGQDPGFYNTTKWSIGKAFYFSFTIVTTIGKVTYSR